MMQITEKKTKLLEDRGMKKVGYILQGEDGQLAYVEGAAVRWLTADQREVFMHSSLVEINNIEIDLLRSIHTSARALMRYNGVDKKRADNAYDAMTSSVHKVNDFDSSGFDATKQNFEYFVYDPQNSFEVFNTKKERDTRAEEFIDGYLEDSWDEEVTRVCAGIITQKTIQTNLVNCPDRLDEDNCDEEGEYWGDWTHRCNYVLSPADIEKEAQPA
jgi:hypothetical protein